MACRKKVLGVCVDFVVDSVTNPGRLIKNATGINTTVSIGGKKIDLTPGTQNLVKQARASLKDIKKTGKQADVDWQNAGKGEIGIWASNYGQSVYNIARAPVNVITGKSSFEKESQKTLGGFQNLAGFGTEGYIGRKKEITSALRDKNFNKNTFNFGKNWAGTSEGTVTLNESGTLSNANRVDMQQMLVKAGAVVAAILTGGAIAGGGSAAGGGGSAAASGVGSSSSLTLPTLGSSAGYGSTATYGLGSTAVGTGAGAGASLGGGSAAAAAGTSWWSTGLGSLAGGIGTGVASSYLNRGVASATEGATSYIDDLLGIGNGGTEDVTPYPSQFLSGQESIPGSYGGDNVTDEIVGLSPMGIAALAVVGFLIYRQVSK